MYRFALAGCGRISKNHVDVLKDLPGASLVACCDVEEERARTVAESVSCPFLPDMRRCLTP